MKKLFVLFMIPMFVFAESSSSIAAVVAVAPAAASGGILSWLSGNWLQLVVAILAIDSALIPLFPSAGLLKSIKSILSSLVGPPKQ